MYRGRKLAVPSNIRPTMDRVREALFNMIDVEGKSFLELFAGSGAISFEALSRGAEHVICVERDQEAVASIRKNVATLNVQSLQIFPLDVVRFFQVASKKLNPSPFHFIFLDPPYHFQPVESILRQLLHINYSNTETTIVYEHSTAFPTIFFETFADELRIQQQRQYGTSVLTFLKRVSMR